MRTVATGTGSATQRVAIVEDRERLQGRHPEPTPGLMADHQRRMELSMGTTCCIATTETIERIGKGPRPRPIGNQPVYRGLKRYRR